MKTTLQNSKQLLLLVVLTLCFTALYAQETTEFTFTFKAEGDAATVQSVTVENLSKGTSVVNMPGNETLYLITRLTTGIDKPDNKTELSSPVIYSAPGGTSNVEFNLQKAGDVHMSIYDMSGKLRKQTIQRLTPGFYAFSLPSMEKGIYALSIQTNGNAWAGKWVSMENRNFDSSDNIKMINSAALNSSVSRTDGSAAFTRVAHEYELECDDNDILRITGTSGNYKTILTAVPWKSQEIAIRFIECIDGNGYNYTVVRIGNDYWMAEDLRATKSYKEVNLNSYSSAALWQNQDDGYTYSDYNSSNSTNIFYKHTTAVKSLPKGWSLPSQEDFDRLFNHFGGRGKKAALALMKEGAFSGATSMEGVIIGQSGFGALACGYFQSNGVFYDKGVGSGYYTRDVNNTNYVYTPYITKDNITVTNSYRVSGQKVRGIYSNSEIGSETLNAIFGNLSYGTEKSSKPVGTVEVMEDNYRSLFVGYGEGDGSGKTAFSHVKVLSNVAVSTTQGTTLSCPADSWVHKWSLKKATPQLNANGRENMVIGVLNKSMWDHTSNLQTTSVSLVTYGDAISGYTRNDVTLSGSFYLPMVRKYVSNTSSGDDIGGHSNWDSENTRMVAAYAFFDVKACFINDDYVEDIVVVCGDKIATYNGVTYALIAEKKLNNDHSTTSYPTDAFYTKIAVGDVDQDGKDDIVAVTSAPKKSNDVVVHVFLGGNLNNEISRRYSGLEAANVAIGNVIGDVKNEIVLNHKKFTSGSPKTRIVSIEVTGNSLSDIINLSDEFATQRALSMDELAIAYLKGKHTYPCIINGIKAFELQGDKYVEIKNGSNSNILAPSSENGINDNIILPGQIVVSNFTDEKSESNPMCEQLVYLFWYENDNDFIWARRLSYSGSAFLIDDDISIFNGNNKLGKPEYCEFPFISAARSTRAAKILKYKGYQSMHSKLTVDALLAVPPFKDGVMDQAKTSFGISNSVGNGSESSYSTSASVIMGFEQEFSAPLIGVKMGGIDFTSKVSAGFTSGYSNETTIIKTKAFEASSTGYNANVIVSTTPYDAYFYEIIKSDNAAEIGEEIMMGFPDKDKRVQIPLSISDYNEITKDDPDAPKLDGILTHKFGDLSSYRKANSIPQNTANSVGLSNLASGKGGFCYQSDILTVNAHGQGSTGTVEIEISNSSQDYKEISAEVETELVVNLGGVKIGGGFGFGGTDKTTKTVGNGFRASANIAYPPASESGNFKNYNCRLILYNYKSGNQIFPVIDYTVD